MPLEDFHKWWKRHRHPISTMSHLTYVQARDAWLAAEARLLDPTGKSLAQQAGIAALQGNEAELGVLADWLADQNKLDLVVAGRLKQLRNMLVDLVENFWPKAQTWDEARAILDLPPLSVAMGPDNLPKSSSSSED
jgi:hypothetical protein